MKKTIEWHVKRHNEKAQRLKDESERLEQLNDIMMNHAIELMDYGYQIENAIKNNIVEFDNKEYLKAEIMKMAKEAEDAADADVTKLLEELKADNNES